MRSNSRRRSVTPQKGRFLALTTPYGFLRKQFLGVPHARVLNAEKFSDLASSKPYGARSMSMESLDNANNNQPLTCHLTVTYDDVPLR
jgi:hypothetical protein